MKLCDTCGNFEFNCICSGKDKPRHLERSSSSDAWLYTDTNNTLGLENETPKAKPLPWGRQADGKKPKNLENLNPGDRLIVIGEGFCVLGEIEFVNLDEVMDEKYPYVFHYKIISISKKKQKLDTPEIRETLLNMRFLKAKNAVLFPYFTGTVRSCSEEVFDYLQLMI